MAGAGYKLYSTGDVLSASDVNTYLQQQTVMVFASAAARTTALASVLAEGMVTYLKDTDVVEIYTGAAWVSLDDPNAIQNSIVTAKGDLIGATASGTPSRVAVGNNGETLVADSVATTGLRYSATPSASNPFLNSAAQVWQRGTTFAFNNNSAYTADRWYCTIANTGATVSRQTTSDTTNLPFIQYCGRLARNAATTNTGAITLTQSFETVNSIPFAGKAVTMSFYARAGANYSSASSGLNVYLVTGTGTDQNQATGYTGQATPISQAVTLTTTWQRFTLTGTIATTATEIACNIGYSPVGTAGAADYFEITGLQLDIGSVALPFRTYAATIQGELAACQRYYYLHASGFALSICNANYYSATQVNGMLQFPATMRTVPSLVASSGTDYYVSDRSGGNDTFNSFTIYRPSTTTTMIYNNTEASGTSGVASLLYTNNSSSSVAFSAEL
jgi:hypothetical protein